MKEIPILFSGSMINAILAGRKMQTRRIVKPQPDESWMQNTKKFSSDGNIFDRNGKQLYWLSDPTGKSNEIKCRYGKPGDLLFVKEEHYIYGHWAPNGTTEKDKAKFKFIQDGAAIFHNDTMLFPFEKSRVKNNEATPMWYKRNSLFMPKSAARIWLRNTGVRVERLQDISEGDAIKEGIEVIKPEEYAQGKRMVYKSYAVPSGGSGVFPYVSFKTLIQSIHGDQVWEENPFCFVINFEVLSLTGRPKNV